MTRGRKESPCQSRRLLAAGDKPLADMLRVQVGKGTGGDVSARQAITAMRQNLMLPQGWRAGRGEGKLGRARRPAATCDRRDHRRGSIHTNRDVCVRVCVWVCGCVCEREIRRRTSHSKADRSRPRRKKTQGNTSCCDGEISKLTSFVNLGLESTFHRSDVIL